MARLLTSRQVADKLAISLSSFRRHLPAMQADGFPGDCPPFKGRWSEDAIDAWINRGGGGGSMPAANDAAPPGLADNDLRETLKRRARG